MAAFASQKFMQALKYPHDVVHQMIAEGSASSRYVIDYIGGNVTQSYDDSTRWSMDVELLVPSAWSVDAFNTFLNTRATTLQPYRGIKFDDGSTELIKFAKFYIADVALSENANGAPTMKIQGYDRSIRAQGDIGTNVPIPLGSNPSTIVPQILAKKLPHVDYALANSQFRTPSLLVTPDQDAWEESRRLMTSVGQDLYFDRENRCVSGNRAIQPSSEYVWHFNENSLPDFRNVERHASNDLFPNVVRVVSTNPGTPNIIGEASDLNPHSSTYRYSDYGEQIRTFRSEQVTTQGQANAMAQYLLSKLLGPQDEITFEAVPNPMLDVGDTIRITRANMGLVQTPLLVTNIQMPLTATDPVMKLTCRQSLFSEITSMPART